MRKQKLKIFQNGINQNKMAIDPEKKRIKIKVKSKSSALEIPEGYERDEKRSKPGKDVFVKKSTTTTTVTPPPNVSQYREATAEEKKSMLEGTFYGKNQAQYREDEKPMGSTSTSKTKLIIKNKEPKYKEEGPSYTGKEKRESRRAERESSRVSRKFSVGCRVGSNRNSRAKY